MDHDNLNLNEFRSSEPYPPIEGIYPDPGCGAIILHDYSGLISELTAILSYRYQHIIVRVKYPKIAGILSGISIVEMTHLEMLGKTILKLGVDPMFRMIQQDQNVFWNAGTNYLGYDKSLKNILRGAIEGETKAAAQYRAHAEEMSNPCVRDILLRIALDEDVHRKILTQLYRRHF
ncbi:MAG: Ferritin Dps family protein [Oscillospiraceae bacterium]|nr:Ferritin Dps family protein [Oscillospiraceae bacterium]